MPREIQCTRMAEIYGHYVTETVITLDLEAPLVSDWERHLRASADAGYPVLVGCVDARVIGFALLMAWKPRPAYHYTAEVSIEWTRVSLAWDGGGFCWNGFSTRHDAWASARSSQRSLTQGLMPRSPCIGLSGSARSAGWNGSASSTTDGSTSIFCNSACDCHGLPPVFLVISTSSDRVT